MADEKKEEKPVKPASPKHSTRKIRGFIDLEPRIEKVNESADSKIDQLIRYGLGDPGKMAFYRKAISNPESSVHDALLRDYVGKSLSILMSVVLSDNVLYTRLRTLLQTRGKELTMEEVSRLAMELRLEARDPEALIAPYKKVLRKKHPRKIEDK